MFSTGIEKFLGLSSNCWLQTWRGRPIEWRCGWQSSHFTAANVRVMVVWQRSNEYTRNYCICAACKFELKKRVGRDEVEWLQISKILSANTVSSMVLLITYFYIEHFFGERMATKSCFVNSSWCWGYNFKYTSNIKLTWRGDNVAMVCFDADVIFNEVLETCIKVPCGMKP